VTGTAWLAAASGVPVRLVYTLDPLPRFVTRFEVRETFAVVGELWALRSVEIEGDGRFLFVRRRVESRLEFSEYFRSDE
jgi:hypothetical protein